MKKKRLAKIVATILICVLIDIGLHLVTNEFSTMPENPNYSKLVEMFGTEIIATIWALLAFSSAAYVFYRLLSSIPGAGLKKGLRYGSAIALLWLFAMLEGVSLFGNSVINEFVIGLSDAIPVLVMSILLSLQKAYKKEITLLKPFTLRQKIIALGVFSGIFLCGRYLAYFTHVIKSGYQTSPFNTFLWTLLMGANIGIIFILLGNSINKLSSKLRAIKFGFFVFGVNWATFLAFMPLMFSGYLIDVIFRIILDTILVSIGYYFTITFRFELKPRLQK